MPEFPATFLSTLVCTIAHAPRSFASTFVGMAIRWGRRCNGKVLQESLKSLLLLSTSLHRSRRSDTVLERHKSKGPMVAARVVCWIRISSRQKVTLAKAFNIWPTKPYRMANLRHRRCVSEIFWQEGNSDEFFSAFTKV